MKILRTTDRNFRYDFGKVYKNRLEISESIQKDVMAILDDIKRMGDQALFKYTEKFDAFAVNTKNVEVTSKEISVASKKIPARDLQILKSVAKRIEDFAKQHLNQSWQTSKDGATLGVRYTPLERVGIYVPGGKAAYPSSVLMTAILARVAGVSEIIMCNPWPRGESNFAVLAAAKIAGVSKIFKVGGAQAIAAMAYGTKSIPKVDKIVGPGNVYVTCAKKFVYGDVDIDMLAGPSEVCVLADGSVSAAYIAADLLAQAEHDQMACPLLVTTDSNYASRVDGEVRMQLARLSRKDIAGVSIQKRALIVLVRNMDEAIDLVNEIAPEHLELVVKNPESFVDRIKHAGAIFLGEHTPETMGDYIAGPSHVLPTSGSARYFSVLQANAFLKATSIVSLTKQAFQKLGPDASRFAEMESLTAHAAAINVR
ncbi:MAG TPA: histidinol dehydrogenase, partial [Deltaproteobacteria bacterium]|nr:histidinol dehydrogenase [Deltaproteobacteria bacterium]